MTNRSEGTNDANDSPPQLPYLLATSDDLHDLDFEAPIRGVKTAECHVLSAKFKGRLLTEDGKLARPVDAAERVFAMLYAITDFYFKPQDRHEPFGPAAIRADGRPSPAPPDFRGVLAVVAEIATRAKNPVLRARLADLCWLLDRKRASLGVLAVNAYIEIVEGIGRGDFISPCIPDNGEFYHTAIDHILRASQIAWALGEGKDEFSRCQDLIADFRKRAIADNALVPISWLSDLDLQFDVSPPVEVAKNIAGVLSAPIEGVTTHIAVRLWDLAARAYRAAGQNLDGARCQAEAAEVWVREAERLSNPLLASHAMSNAIAKLGGLHDKKDRRKKLKHSLVEIQSEISEELISFSIPINLEELIENGKKAVGGYGLIESLFRFANLCPSPELATVRSNALNLIAHAPLSALFATHYLDQEGKTIHRTPEGGNLGEANGSAIHKQIAYLMATRRGLAANGTIEAARREIVANHFFSEDIFASLLQYSPFVPPHLIVTFSRGFTRFFQGDFISAIYILAPLLENSLRHVLKLSGHDVSIFDDATQTQKDRTLSSLFSGMRNELDAVFTKPITFDIENLFLTRPGTALRHELAHGLISDGTAYGADAIYGCWLIFSLCMIPLYQCFESTQSESACKTTEKSP